MNTSGIISTIGRMKKKKQNFFQRTQLSYSFLTFSIYMLHYIQFIDETLSLKSNDYTSTPIIKVIIS